MLEDRKENPETYFRLTQNLLTLRSIELKSKKNENLLYVCQVSKTSTTDLEMGRSKNNIQFWIIKMTVN